MVFTKKKLNKHLSSCRKIQSLFTLGSNTVLSVLFMENRSNLFNQPLFKYERHFNVDFLLSLSHSLVMMMIGRMALVKQALERPFDRDVGVVRTHLRIFVEERGKMELFLNSEHGVSRLQPSVVPVQTIKK